jgi:hypothetical protein
VFEWKVSRIGLTEREVRVPREWESAAGEFHHLSGAIDAHHSALSGATRNFRGHASIAAADVEHVIFRRNGGDFQ